MICVVLPSRCLGSICKGTGENMDDEVTYRQQVSFCGKPRCRKCQQGIGHGPYWFSYQVVDGRTIRTYIGKNFPPGVQVPTSQTSPSIAANPTVRKAARTKQDMQIGRSNQSPLVGREHELRLLQLVLTSTERSLPASSRGQKNAARSASAVQALETAHPQCIVLIGRGRHWQDAPRGGSSPRSAAAWLGRDLESYLRTGEWYSLSTLD